MPAFRHFDDAFLNGLFDFNGDGKITADEMFLLKMTFASALVDGVRSALPDPDEKKVNDLDDDDDWADVDDWDYEDDEEEPFFY